jgi:hypothetical protein
MNNPTLSGLNSYGPANEDISLQHIRGQRLRHILDDVAILYKAIA